MKLIDLNNRAWQWIVLVALAFIWGSSFILMKRGLVSFSNYQVAELRIFISFLFFIPFIIKHFKALKRRHIKSLLIAGFIGNAIPALLFTTAQTQISSSLAGILNSTTPIFTMLVGVLLYKTKSKLINTIGLIIALIGASGLIVKDFDTVINGTNWFALLAVLATLCYGINVNEVKANLKDMNGVAISALSFMFVGPVAGIMFALSDFEPVFASEVWKISLLYISLLAMFSSFIAVTFMNILIKYTTPVFVASVTYIIPIFAIIWGLFDGEILTIRDFIWIVVVIFGVYLVNKK